MANKIKSKWSTYQSRVFTLNFPAGKWLSDDGFRGGSRDPVGGTADGRIRRGAKEMRRRREDGGLASPFCSMFFFGSDQVQDARTTSPLLCYLGEVLTCLLYRIRPRKVFSFFESLVFSRNSTGFCWNCEPWLSVWSWTLCPTPWSIDQLSCMCSHRFFLHAAGFGTPTTNSWAQVLQPPFCSRPTNLPAGELALDHRIKSPIWQCKSSTVSSSVQRWGKNLCVVVLFSADSTATFSDYCCLQCITLNTVC